MTGEQTWTWRGLSTHAASLEPAQRDLPIFLGNTTQPEREMEPRADNPNVVTARRRNTGSGSSSVGAGSAGHWIRIAA